jgi:transglutaminase-like putative cysteine protease
VGAVDRYFELSVLGLVSSGYLAVLGSGYLDAPTAIAVAVGLLLRALMVLGVLRFTISGRVTAALTIAYICFYPADYFLLSRSFVTATVRLVFFLAVVKVLTARAPRDYAFLGVIGSLELLSAAIVSANLTFFVFLAAFLVFGVAAFASAEIRRSMRKPRYVARSGPRRFSLRLASLTMLMSLGILLLTGFLFFLLPRTAQVAFRHLVPQRDHVPGFSNSMELGEIGEIQQRQGAVMHVRVGATPLPPGLKWRGMALTRFDGRRWSNPPDPGVPLRVNKGLLTLADLHQRWRTGTRIQYEVQLNPMVSDALFFAGTPELVVINSPLVIRTSGNSYRLGVPNMEGLRYGAYAFLEETGVPEEPMEGVATAAYLQLPRLDPRIPALARRITEGAGSDEARARAIERHLQTSYRYTTRLLSHEVRDPLAYFLFHRKAGHCEYFASAMAVMLRTLGIPSRIATGFVGGVFNPVSGWYIVRASDAHSWVEAYLPGRGWTTFDPTPFGGRTDSASLWARFGFYMDAADTFWQEWVLNYNLDRQLVLASRMENSGRSFGLEWIDSLHASAIRWRDAVVAWWRRHGIATVLVALAALAAWLAGPKLWAWWLALRRVRQARRGEARSSDATLIYGRMLRLLKRRGFEKPAWVTPSEFARMLPRPETAALVASFTAAYNDLRFGGNPGAAPRMMALLAEIEHTPRR